MLSGNHTQSPPIPLRWHRRHRRRHRRRETRRRCHSNLQQIVLLNINASGAVVERRTRSTTTTPTLPLLPYVYIRR